MGSNYFLVPKAVASDYRALWHKLDMIRQSLKELQQYESVNQSELSKTIDTLPYPQVDELPGVIHIGKASNQHFIWNISPARLEEMFQPKSDLEIWHENSSDPICSHALFTQLLYYHRHDTTTYVGKNIWFR